MDIHDYFFPIESRGRKFVDFVNLKQEGMNVKDYSLKLTQLSMYAPTLKDKSKDRMNKFVIRVSCLGEEECRMIMLHNNIDL